MNDFDGIKKKKEKKSQKIKNEALSYINANEEPIDMTEKEEESHFDDYKETSDTEDNAENLVEIQEGESVSSFEDIQDDDEEAEDEGLAYRQSLERRGVIYMSRIPPFMKPNKARSIFEQYGDVTRLYLAEENAEFRKKRKEHGGNGSKQFREGVKEICSFLF
jgi:ESF2/ABP1 family protein